jgi:hypothetical protein
MAKVTARSNKTIATGRIKRFIKIPRTQFSPAGRPGPRDST